MAEDVLAAERLVLERDGGDQVDQLAELGLVDLQLGVALVEHALELGVVALDGVEGVVDQGADGADLLLGLALIRLELAADDHLVVVLQEFPAGFWRHPEDVGFGVVVADFQFFLGWWLRIPRRNRSCCG